MANYLYNGVELPDINAVWTDKVKYPYANVCIGHTTSGYWIYITGEKPYYTEELLGTKGAKIASPYVVYKMVDDAWVFSSTSDQYDYDTATAIPVSELLWTNYDLKDEAGALYFAASDPVPVEIEITARANSYVSTGSKWSQNDYYERVNGEWLKRTAYARLGGKWAKVVKAAEPIPTSYLTFSSAGAFTLATNNAAKNWDGALYYSTDTKTWSEWDGTVAIASAEYEGEQRVYVCGSGNSVICGSDQTEDNWSLIGNNIRCEGNIESLLDHRAVSNGEHPSMSAYCFTGMFNGCTALTTAPELPATTLVAHCYNSMFLGCTSLIATPKLPATTLAKYCYRNMFSHCTNLTTVSELPATTLASSCYRTMFYGCTSLVTAPELPATTLTDYCYGHMFYNCTNIKFSTTQSDEYPNEYRIPTSGTGTTATDALKNMFYGTGGTFAGTPSINTTYYTSNTVV